MKCVQIRDWVDYCGDNTTITNLITNFFFKHASKIILIYIFIKIEKQRSNGMVIDNDFAVSARHKGSRGASDERCTRRLFWALVCLDAHFSCLGKQTHQNCIENGKWRRGRIERTHLLWKNEKNVHNLLRSGVSRARCLYDAKWTDAFLNVSEEIYDGFLYIKWNVIWKYSIQNFSEK